MISKAIINFSENFIINNKKSPNDQDFIENFVNNNYFENLLINLAEIDTYYFKVSDEFFRFNAISLLPP